MCLGDQNQLLCLTTKIYSLLESISDASGSDDGRNAIERKLWPLLVLDVEGADVDMSLQIKVQATAESIDLIRVGGVVRGLEPA